MAEKKRVLYIGRFPARNRGLSDKIRNRLTAHRIGEQDGFFRGALHCAFDVRETTLADLQRKPGRARDFDALAVNLKCTRDGKHAGFEDIAFLAGIDVPKILAVTNAEPENMPDDRVLDLFGNVFKREVYTDRDRYSLSQSNKSKLHATMLSCPLIPATTCNIRRIDPRDYGFSSVSAHENHDVFFSGSSTSPERMNILQAIESSGLDFTGALQARKSADGVPAHMNRKSLNRKEYIGAVRGSRISLALAGYGPFTYRHLELFCLSAFCLSSPSVRGLDLPMPMKENVHFVAYENKDDLIGKCRHYIKNDTERHRIAANGRRLFEEYYSFRLHGDYVSSVLFPAG